VCNANEHYQTNYSSNVIKFLSLCSWAYLQRHLTKIDKEARELKRKLRPVNYRIHLGHGIYASVSDGYKCVDLKRFYLLYGLQGEHNIRPTKHGMFISVTSLAGFTKNT